MPNNVRLCFIDNLAFVGLGRGLVQAPVATATTVLFDFLSTSGAGTTIAGALAITSGSPFTTSVFGVAITL